MSKHTPGPWIVSEKGWLGATVSGDGIEICVVGLFGSSWTKHRELEQNYADADLIAAAPDLLEACKRVAVWFGLRADLAPAPDDLLKELLSLIDKAEPEGWEPE